MSHNTYATTSRTSSNNLLNHFGSNLNTNGINADSGFSNNTTGNYSYSHYLGDSTTIHGNGIELFDIKKSQCNGSSFNNNAYIQNNGSSSSLATTSLYQNVPTAAKNIPNLYA